MEKECEQIVEMLPRLSAGMLSLIAGDSLLPGAGRGQEPEES